MAKPQKENGYTGIAHEILEEVSKRKFNATQLSILLIVWRMTYGFNRKDHELAVNFFVKRTGFSKRNIHDGLNSLIDNKVLIETQKASFNQTRKLAFNKNYDDWMVDSRTNGKQVKNSSPDEEKVTSTDEQKFTSTGEESFTQERNTLNKNIKEKTSRSKLKFETHHMQLAELLFKKMLVNNPKVKKPKLEQWADTFRKMMELDKREGKEIQDAIIWSQQDSFWHKNILSADSLRKQFDRLYLEMNSKKPKPQEPTGRYIPDTDEIDLTAGEDW